MAALEQLLACKSKLVRRWRRYTEIKSKTVRVKKLLSSLKFPVAIRAGNTPKSIHNWSHHTLLAFSLAGPTMSTEVDPSSNERNSLRREYEQLAQLAGGLAHEIRNPLSTICLNLEVLKEELEGEESAKDRRMLQRLVSIQKECGYLEQLLNEFLQFTRGLKLDLKPCDLSAVVAEFIAFQNKQASQQQVEISFHLTTDLPEVLLDPAQFQSVLRNLTINAFQAMPHGGTLEFQTYSNADQVVLEIIDSGQGMPADKLEKIFDLFYSTKSKGSGLGLPTARKIVEAHQGTLSCESEPGKGTRFRLSLPSKTNFKKETFPQ